MLSNLGFTSPGTANPSIRPDTIRYDSMPSVYNTPQISAAAIPYRNDWTTGNYPLDVMIGLGNEVLLKETEDTKPPAEQSKPGGTVSNNLVNSFQDNGVVMLLTLAGVYLLYRYLR